MVTGDENPHRESQYAIGTSALRLKSGRESTRMIDLHSHVLPGLDDGTRSLDEACELAQVLAADGVHTVAATPHVREDYPTQPEAIERGVEALREELSRRGIEVELVTGAEVALDPASTLDHATLVRYSYGGRGAYLLLEFPYTEWPLALHGVIHRLLGLGLTPVLAHPERNHAVQRNPERLQELVATGALVQVTSSSVLGTFGSGSRRCALELLRSGTAHLLASDAHDAVSRDVRLSRAIGALRRSGARALADGGGAGCNPRRRARAGRAADARRRGSTACGGRYGSDGSSRRAGGRTAGAGAACGSVVAITCEAMIPRKPIRPQRE